MGVTFSVVPSAGPEYAIHIEHVDEVYIPSDQPGHWTRLLDGARGDRRLSVVARILASILVVTPDIRIACWVLYALTITVGFGAVPVNSVVKPVDVFFPAEAVHKVIASMTTCIVNVRLKLTVRERRFAGTAGMCTKMIY